MPRLTNKLPDKPSDLIDVALKDLAKAERSKKFEIDMNVWCEPADLSSDVCAVCLGGSVLVGTVGLDAVDGANWWIDEIITKHDSVRIEALDALRCGNIVLFLEYVYDNSASARRCRQAVSIRDKNFDDYCTYREDPDQFKRWCRKVARDLRQVGM